MFSLEKVVLVAAFLSIEVAHGFVAPVRRLDSPQPLTVREMGFMDGFKKAFDNEDFAEKPSAGLSATKQKIEVSICGKKTQALPGQRMKDLVRSSRAPIKFNCENGECGTCECLVNGRKVRVCMYKVPNKGPVEVKLK